MTYPQIYLELLRAGLWSRPATVSGAVNLKELLAMAGSQSTLPLICKALLDREGLDLKPELKEKLVSGVTIDLSNSYSFVNQVHGILVHGGTVVMVPGACMNPEFYKSIQC